MQGKSDYRLFGNRSLGARPSPVRFGSLWIVWAKRIIAKPCRLPFPLFLFPRALPWAVIVLHLRCEDVGPSSGLKTQGATGL